MLRSAVSTSGWEDCITYLGDAWICEDVLVFVGVSQRTGLAEKHHQHLVSRTLLPPPHFVFKAEMN